MALTPSSRASQLWLSTVGAVQGRAIAGRLHVDATAVSDASTLTLFACKSALVLLSIVAAEQCRAVAGHLHVDAASSTAAASALTPSSRASQLRSYPCSLFRVFFVIYSKNKNLLPRKGSRRRSGGCSGHKECRRMGQHELSQLEYPSPLPTVTLRSVSTAPVGCHCYDVVSELPQINPAHSILAPSTSRNF